MDGLLALADTSQCIQEALGEVIELRGCDREATVLLGGSGEDRRLDARRVGEIEQELHRTVELGKVEPQCGSLSPT